MEVVRCQEASIKVMIILCAPVLRDPLFQKPFRLAVASDIGVGGALVLRSQWCTSKKTSDGILRSGEGSFGIGFNHETLCVCMWLAVSGLLCIQTTICYLSLLKFRQSLILQPYDLEVILT